MSPPSSPSGKLPVQVEISDKLFARTYNSALLLRGLANGNLVTTTPLEIYQDASNSARTTIRLGNGGAGYTGILATLSKAYSNRRPSTECPLDISWIPNHSHHTLVALLGGIVDIALTYEPASEDLAVSEGWAHRVGRVFNDHFIIVGPVSDPSGTGKSLGKPGRALDQMLRDIASSGEEGNAVWHSRGDGSATFIKERALFANAGLTKLLDVASWLQTHHVAPYAALERANADGAYLLTDRATFLTAQRNGAIPGLRVYFEGGTQLLNPCAAMVRIDADAEVLKLAGWLCGREASEIVRAYGKDWGVGKALFTVAEHEEFPEEDRIIHAVSGTE